MSPFNVSPRFWNVWGVLLLILLVVPVMALLLRRWLWVRKSPLVGETLIKQTVTKPSFPGIDPADYATAVEQQTALDRLSQLPQFRRLNNGTLIDWGSGACIEACDCPLPPLPHLMISWSPRRAQGIVSKSGLAHYVAYQERVAAVLLARPQFLNESDETGEAH